MLKWFILYSGVLWAQASLALPRVFTTADCGKPGITCKYGPDKTPLSLRHVENEKVLSGREFKNGAFTAGFDFHYRYDEKAQDSFPWSYEIYGDRGEVLHSFDNEDNRRGSIPCGVANRPVQFKAMVIDRIGADLRHPDIKNKLWINTQESWNNVDDDGNGLVDDCVGFSVDAWAGNRHILSPMFYVDGALDADHSTMGLSIAAKDLSQVGFIPVAGDTQKAAFYPPVIQTIAREKVRFVNISLSFEVYPEGFNGQTSDEGRFITAKQGMENLINQSPSSLFFIAAGNGPFLFRVPRGANVDKYHSVPASFPNDNIISVGAINTDEINPALLPTYERAIFSNFGVTGVDLFAPGVNLSGAQAGGGHKTASGTSFSSPYLMNIAMKAARLAPTLSNSALKELILKTVYIPDLESALGLKLTDLFVFKDIADKPKLLPCRSGGIIFPDRLFAAVRIFNSRPDLSIEEIALQSRLEVQAPGEKNDDETVAKIIRLWREHQI